MGAEHRVDANAKVGRVLSLQVLQRGNLSAVDLGVKVEKAALLHGFSLSSRTRTS